MNVNNTRFVISAVKPEQYPNDSLPEIAFVGRSNVGKSSMINCLLNRKKIAKVGNTPGKTRLINFFSIDDTIFFVDLPGYGYAKVSKSERKSWGQIIERYLNSSKLLTLIIMLTDIRHKPSNEDKTMYDWICAKNLPHLIVATKADKLSKAKMMKNIHMIKSELGCQESVEVIPFSSTSRLGKDKVWANIEGLL